MSNETSNDESQGDTDENSYQGTYSNLVYVFSSDKTGVQHLASSLTRHNHDVVCFNELEEFRAAILVRAPHAVILDIDSESGQRAKKAFANRVITSFPVIYV